MFLNLARRSQSLIDRQLEVLAALPDTNAAELPAKILELDQLATRMRRNAENLIVLSGSEPTRDLLVQSDPLATAGGRPSRGDTGDMIASKGVPPA